MVNTRKLTRILTVSLLMLLLVCTLFCLSSCDMLKQLTCKHTDTVKETTATCSAPGMETVTCKKCGKVLSETPVVKLEHSYVADAENSVAATCTTDGKSVLKCEHCGDLAETTIPKTGHNYVADAQNSVAATCSSAGVDVKKCSNCSEVIRTDIAQLHHSFKADNSLSTAATCTTAGKEVSVCEHCGAKNETVLDAKGHTFLTASGAAATACAEGECECGERKPATEAHNYTLTDDTADCENDGEKTYGCIACGHSYTEASAAIGHNVKVWSETPTLLGAVTGGDKCVYEYSHTGTCTNCNKTVTDKYQVVNHKYVLTVTKNATCNEQGEQKMVCSVCNAIDETAETVKFWGDHSFGAFVDAGDGISTSECSVCHTVRTKSTGTTATVNKDTLKQEVELNGGAVVKMDEESSKFVGDGDVTLGAEGLTKDQLGGISEDELSKVGEEDIVYNITLTDENGEPITQFGEGKVTVKLPYTLKNGDDPRRITIFYLSGEKVIAVDAVFTETDAETHFGFVTFETNHFSYYLVGLYSDAELCAKFGHEYIVAYKAATCTEGGYHIETCKRCGGFGIKETYSPLGHSTALVPGSRVEATCTTPGYEDRSCTKCTYHIRVVIPATGHSWTLEENVAATCTAPGHKDFECSCGAKYTETVAQLKHTLTKTKVEPTCTNMGYTTYTCSVCNQYSYTTDYTPALGHTWNIDAPTCGQGQNCLVCGVVGAPATGNHTMGSDGKCSVCGLGCEHNYTVTEKVDATCVLSGYTVYTCSKCGGEKIENYVAAKGHQFADTYSDCSVCGKANPAAAQAFRDMVAGLVSESYSLKIENLKIVATSVITVNGGEPKTEPVADIDMEFFEVQIVRKNGKILVYAHGIVDYVLTEDGENIAMPGLEVTVYGDGEYLYAEVPEDPSYDPIITSDAVTIQRISYSEMMENITGEFMDEAFGGENITIEQFLEQLTANPIVGPWLELIESKEDDIVVFIGNFVLSFYNKETTSNGTVYTFDLERFREFNNNLTTLTVSELIDEYFGEGSFEGIIEYLESLNTKTLREAAMEIIDLLSGIGIPSDLVFSTINLYIESQTEQPFDIMEMLNSPEYKDITVAELVMQIISNMGDNNNNDNVPDPLPDSNIPSHNCYDKNGDGICDACGSMFGYITKPMEAEVEDEEEAPTYLDLIAQLEKMASSAIIYDMLPEDIADQIYGLLDTVFDSEKVAFSFTLDKNDKPVSASFSVSNADLHVFTGKESDKNDDDESGSVSVTEGWINASFDISFLLNGEMPKGADRIKNEYNANLNKLTTSIKKALASGAYPNGLFFRSPSSGMALYGFILKDNEVYLVVNYITEMTELPLASVDLYMVPDCTNAYNVTGTVVLTMENINGETETRHIRMDFCFNAITNAFSEYSFHDFRNEYTGDIPDGIYLTEEEAPCDAKYGKYYQCSCGTIERDTYWKNHDYRDVVSLLPGSTTCEDGVLIQHKCVACGDVSHEHESTDHYANIVSKKEFKSGDHTIIALIYQCPCQFDHFVEFYDERHDGDNGNYYCKFSDSINYNEFLDKETGVLLYTAYRMNCAYEGCNSYIEVVVYPEERTTLNGSSCVIVEKSHYRIYTAEGTKPVYEFDIFDHAESHYTYRKGELAEDSLCCAEGAYRQDVCRDCGTLIWQEKISWHETYYKETKTFEINGETEEYEIYTCPCGCTTEINYQGQCYLDFTDSEKGAVNHHGCGCFVSYERTYKFMYDGEVIHTYTFTNYEESHSLVKVSGNMTNEYCTKCDYRMQYIREYDTFGRLIKYADIHISFSGKELNFLYNEYRYVADNSCECYVGYKEAYDGELIWNNNSTVSNHTYADRHIFQEGTCTQPTSWTWKCSFCGLYDHNKHHYSFLDKFGNDRESGHAWQELPEDSPAKYQCKDCGLYSDQGGSDICLEDLTNRGTFAVDNSFVIGYTISNFKEFSRLNIMFSFVDKNKHYSEEGSTLPAMLIQANVIEDDGGYGRFGFSKDAVTASIEELLKNPAYKVNASSVDEFLANYDLAITVNDRNFPNYGPGLDGAYSVIVLENLSSYFTK